jgi:hypothetical protein
MIEELKAFDGDVWIIGSAFPWARSKGIDGVYFNIDPTPSVVEETPGVTKAILGSGVDASVFAALKASGADVSVFDLVENSERLNHGVTTATAVPELSILLGYTDVTFFGCESSFERTSHAYGDVEAPMWLVIECGGKRFMTRPDFLMQAEFMSTMIRRFPKIFKEESGGLLRALVADPDYDVERVSEALYATLKFGVAA